MKKYTIVCSPSIHNNYNFIIFFELFFNHEINLLYHNYNLPNYILMRFFQILEKTNINSIQLK